MDFRNHYELSKSIEILGIVAILGMFCRTMGGRGVSVFTILHLMSPNWSLTMSVIMVLITLHMTLL